MLENMLEYTVNYGRLVESTHDAAKLEKRIARYTGKQQRQLTYLGLPISHFIKPQKMK